MIVDLLINNYETKRIIKLGDNRLIGDSYKPYIVAELNTSPFEISQLQKNDPKSKGVRL